MDKSFQEIIDEVLADHDISAEEMLEQLMRVMVDRHVDVELRRMGRKEPYPIHNERADALKAVNDAVHQAHAKGGKETPLLQAVRAMLIACQFAGERAAGIGGDDEEDDGPGGPGLRLVRD